MNAINIMGEEVEKVEDLNKLPQLCRPHTTVHYKVTGGYEPTEALAKCREEIKAWK